MVREANIKQAAAEKALKESTMKVDVLTAEVAALKTLVLTSTPSKPNLHLHSQCRTKEDNSPVSGEFTQRVITLGNFRFARLVVNNDMRSIGGGSFFKKQHHRSPSHFDLKYGRELSPCQLSLEDINHASQSDPLEVKDGYEVCIANWFCVV